MKKIKKFFSPAFCEKKVTFKALFPWIVASIIWIITVYLLKEITNKIWIWATDEVKYLLAIFIFFIIIWYFIVIFTRNWIKVTFRPIYRKHIYSYIIKNFIHSDNNEVEKVWTWKLIATFDKWLFSWVDLLSKVITEIIPSLIFIIFSFIFIWLINLYYWLIVWIIFVFIFILTVSFQEKAKIYREKRRDTNIYITSKFVNILISKFEVLQNWKVDNELEIISKSLYKNINYNKKVQNYNIITELMMTILIDWSKIWIIIMFWIGFWTNIINMWEFVSLMSIVYVLDQIFKKSIATYIDFTKIIVNVEKLWDFFDKTPTMKWYDTWENFEYKKWEIELKNVNYWYIKNKPVFENLDLKLKWWKVTAFVGNSWSWKSTLVKLIAGYIRADSGEIIIDGQKLNDIKLKTYYKNIGYLTQDPSVFDGSILDNLMYWVVEKVGYAGLHTLQNNSRDVWQKHLEKIIKQSKCEFIYDLEKWLDTEIWERWVRLSWGQKQRLAIAKIMLKDPKIIILDEPTSALDSFSEEQITYAMHNLFKNRTVIIIAHRLQTVKEASDIILFENWKIKERWTHKELVELKWDYNKMLELQSGF